MGEHTMTTYIAEITSPVLGTFAALTKLYPDFQVFSADDLFRAIFVNLLRFAVNQEWKRSRAVDWDERHAYTSGVERL